MCQVDIDKLTQEIRALIERHLTIMLDDPPAIPSNPPAINPSNRKPSPVPPARPSRPSGLGKRLPKDLV